ncbi:MAG: F0F1 ATP synthase subunit gamma [Actinomycetota bacterium]|nr:F0F1 ATP synthase subunit gamma [Actinomycetota bacterium]
MAEKARDIRRRIRSIESTKKITNAMQLIAASRIAKAQARTEAARPFARAIGEMIKMLASESKSSPLLAERDIRTTAIVVLTGDRGLAGAYNANVLREAQRAVARQRQVGREAKVTSVGRKGASYFRFRGTELAGFFSGMADKPSYADAKKIADGIIGEYLEERVDLVQIAYTEFLSAGVQRARVAQILPVPRPEEQEPKEGPSAMFDFEPEPDALLEALLPRYVEVKIYGALLESSTSEHAARMRAMKSATDKAEELIKVFQLRANKARQSEITNEIADIVGATEALTSAHR